MTVTFRKHAFRRQSGEINILLIPFVFLLMFFVGSLIFGLWAYSQKEDYRTNVQQKIDAAVKVAKQEESVVKDQQFAEADKLPLKTYAGPEQFGSVHVSYPKSWSGYVLDTISSGQPLNGYFQPGLVPNISDANSAFALRVQILNTTYASTVSAFNGAVISKALTATPYAFPKVPNVVGIRYDGAVQSNKKITGSMVIMPVRDKTLEIWTESPLYIADFNNNILPNVTFIP